MLKTVIPNRRVRLRQQTLAEIKGHAAAQVAAEGAPALSLNAVARAMGMSGPAIYRYFASRDDLLAALVVDAYEDLAEAMEAAAEFTGGATPERRFRALSEAYRAWALAHPHRYRLLFSTPSGSGQLAPERTVPAAHRNMAPILDTLGDLVASPAAAGDTHLALQLEEWADGRSSRPALPSGLLQLAVLSWTRLHGVVSLEIEGVFASMDIDPALVYAAEVEYLIAHGAAASPVA